MGKLIEILALLSIVTIFIGSVLFPESSFMWLATVTSNLTLLRIVLITLIATLLISGSLFDHHLHWLLGIFAVGLGSWALYGTYDNHLQILDGLSFLGTSIALALEALQPNLEAEPAPEPVALRQLSTGVKQKVAIYTLAAYAITRFLTLTHPFGHHKLQQTESKPSSA